MDKRVYVIAENKEQYAVYVGSRPQYKPLLPTFVAPDNLEMVAWLDPHDSEVISLLERGDYPILRHLRRRGFRF